jgi:membrane protein implicated in regulation of membrane protease activity
MNGFVLFVVAAALFVASACTMTTSWSLPLLVGGFVAIAAGIYQRWWTMVTFDEHPHARRRRAHHLRVTAHRERADHHV